MTGPGPCVRLPWRQWLLATPAAVLLIGLAAWLPLADPASAQSDPAQVTGVSASADDHDSITVSWNAVTSTCGSNSLYYEVRWDDDSGFASPQDEDFIPNTTDSYQITGLQEGTPYFVQVRGVCVNVFGFYTAEGEWSAASATTDLQPPERVTGVIADATSDVEIMVSWMMAIRADGYVVQWREDGQSFDASRQAAVAALTYDVTGLTADTRYYFQVIATRAGATTPRPQTRPTPPPKTLPRWDRLPAWRSRQSPIGSSRPPGTQPSTPPATWCSGTPTARLPIPTRPGPPAPASSSSA